MVELPDKEGVIQQRWTMGMITRSAKNNWVMRNIHNAKPEDPRMPLFLPFELCQMWMNKDLSEQEYREILGYEFPANELEYYPVDTIRSSKPRADGKPKTAPFEWAGLPALGEANPI